MTKINILVLLFIGFTTYALTLHLGQGSGFLLSTGPAYEEKNTDRSVFFFEFTDIHGVKHSIKDFKDKTIILNFWASWCAPCVKEFPLLLKAAHQNPDDVVLIALSSDLDAEAIHKFIAKMQRYDFDAPNILIALDENQEITGNIFGIRMLPETILIGPEQTMRHKFIGADWAYDDLDQWL